MYGFKNCYKRLKKSYTQLASQAAQKQYPNALNSLGYCYLWGYGVEQDKIKAVDLFTKTAKKGYSQAQNRLAYCYLNG